MGTWKSLGGHVLTAVLTIVVVLAFFGEGQGRRRPKETPPGLSLAQAAGQPAPTRPGQAAPPRTPFELPVVAPLEIPADVLKGVNAEEQDNIRVYATVNKSVVNITTASDSGGLFGDETTSGTGSGFVFDNTGHILTNYHVVEGAESVQVTLFDGSTHEAQVVGVDASNDVAVVQVRVPSNRLVSVRMGDSSKLLVGQKVLALGNPFGLERTLTTGIVSALDRSIKAKNGRMIKGIIQTDAAVNPGNSGGPLLNSRGEVIGMNTAILSQVGQSAGISFAVPINPILRILKPLIENGRVIRADLGVTRVLTTTEGLAVVSVSTGGPAERAGIQPIRLKILRYGSTLFRRPDPDSADVIIAVEGKRMRTVEDLLTEIESHAPGDVVSVTVLREGRARDIPVTLGES
ncbi:MAG: trypsin-like peptidase domain-containing protein [Isosphaeraceae bacterium]